MSWCGEEYSEDVLGKFAREPGIRDAAVRCMDEDVVQVLKKGVLALHIFQ